jgi:hypothetical protein
VGEFPLYQAVSEAHIRRLRAASCVQNDRRAALAHANHVHLVAVDGVKFSTRRVRAFVYFGSNSLKCHAQYHERDNSNTEPLESTLDIEQAATPV